ncbi:hypothetical protein AB2N04_14000 [Nitratireductor sp. GISD-1A_MAKvit]|uniref:hypothetical protein n=1 Tax=Nitratireductor sp. GISD-1A_MAKvit TaxID=3234198 RepID=UPI00346578F1
MTMARYGRSMRTALAAAAMLALSGCYETQLPIVTQQNAYTSPLIPDGRYCEMTFEDTRPVTGTGQCITLTWVDGANGWRTDNLLLPGDEHGVSIRARKLGHGNDAVDRSGFFMVQAGPQPRQAAIGGRTVPVATAHLMAVLRRGDMFAVIDRHLPQAPVIERAHERGIGLAPGESRLTIPSVSTLSSDRADLVGAWLARELTHEVHAAAFPGAEPERNAIRIFVPGGVADREGPDELAARARTMLDAVVFEAGVLNQALGLGLPPARIDPEILNRTTPSVSPAPSSAPMIPASPSPAQPEPPARGAAVQAPYDRYRHCMGLLDGARSYATVLSAYLGDMAREARLAGHAGTAADLEGLRETAENEAAVLTTLQAHWDDLGERFEALGADRQVGEISFLLGKTEFGVPDQDRLWSGGGELSAAIRKLRTNRDAVMACFSSIRDPSAR